MVSFEDFKKIDIRVARIKEAQEHPNADKLLVLKLDTGAEERQVVAGIKNFYKPEDLLGKKVIAITNLESAKIRGVESAGMVLVASDENILALLAPEKDIKEGSKIS
jgi:methionyl-tRNA synthetase